MSLALAVVAFIGGVSLLLFVSRHVITAAHGLGQSLGLHPAVAGLTIVAFATSAPELAVVLLSLAADDPDIATGSVAGSNIANVLIVVGATAVISSFPVDERARRVDIPIVVVVSLAVTAMAFDRELGRLDGGILLAGLACYLIVTLRSRGAGVEDELEAGDGPSRARLLFKLLAAALGLAVSARLVVIGAEELASAAGVSQLIIGLTVVSIGTSLPEIATSLAAARAGHPEIALGNAVGSNLFNVLLVLGVAGLVAPIEVADSVARVDFPVMTGAAALLAIVAVSTGRIRRWHGVVLLAGYATYIATLSSHG